MCGVVDRNKFCKKVISSKHDKKTELCGVRAQTTRSNRHKDNVRLPGIQLIQKMDELSKQRIQKEQS